MDCAAPGHVKELKRLNMGLRMKFSDEKPCEVEAFSNSNCVSDKEHRKSVTGMAILVSGVPISWKSKGKLPVTLSSTKSGYVALCETV
jgi:hypothetical protein